MNILVTGGAGYVGSHVVRMLTAAGHQPVVVDNLAAGHRASVGEVSLHQVDLADAAVVDDVFGRYKFDAVMHFAGATLVGESVRDPGKYFRSNLAYGLNLLEAMAAHRVGRLVFSSTAAVYGEPHEVPISEDHPKQPINPYGEAKLFFEHVLHRYDTAHGIRSISLRYFNAAGADPSGEIGEDHDPETHLIPIVLQAALGQREAIHIFGTDYPTPDGTCVRDYIHVNDLGAAHLLALDALAQGAATTAYNLGNGRGFSVREVIAAAEQVVGKSIPVQEAERRPGDPTVLVAGSDRIRRELGWEPQIPELQEIVATAWEWHRQHPGGYGDGGGEVP